ncbi:rod shape-determining protein [Spiroplasma endosymbiont of Amphibalanus improvisus]|uniref:rod shape-determining protein n=1 Tax=Spiroplasma endosymbiont of Amphibalanus improvisus TaxID=3066327 RepID=UPI00313D876A
MLNINNKKYNYIALDLGTSQTSAYIEGFGIIFDEPSLMSFDIKTNKIIAIGNESKKHIGTGLENIKIMRPLKNSVITSFDLVQTFITEIFKKFNEEKNTNIWKDSIVTITAPAGLTDMEKTAIENVCKKLGAIYVYVEDSSLMAAFGAGENIFESGEATIILDFGGGTANCSIISAGNIVVSKSANFSSTTVDEEIKKYVKSCHNISIGLNTAEKIKMEIGSLWKGKRNKSMKVYGRDVVSGMPEQFELKEDEIRRLIVALFNNVIVLITEVLEKTPSELTESIIEKGILVVGAGSLIVGFEEFINSVTDIKTRKVNNPVSAVIEGCIMYKKRIIKELSEKI